MWMEQTVQEAYLEPVTSHRVPRAMPTNTDLIPTHGKPEPASKRTQLR